MQAPEEWPDFVIPIEPLGCGCMWELRIFCQLTHLREEKAAMNNREKLFTCFTNGKYERRSVDRGRHLVKFVLMREDERILVEVKMPHQL